MNRVNDVDLPELFRSCRTIAVVGLSNDQKKNKKMGGIHDFHQSARLFECCIVISRPGVDVELRKWRWIDTEHN